MHFSFRRLRERRRRIPAVLGGGIQRVKMPAMQTTGTRCGERDFGTRPRTGVWLIAATTYIFMRRNAACADYWVILRL